MAGALFLGLFCFGFLAGGAKSKRTGKARAGPSPCGDVTRIEAWTKRSPIGSRPMHTPGIRALLFLHSVSSSAIRTGALGEVNSCGN